MRELLEPLGAHVDVLAMQPGGPQAWRPYRGVPVVCFPGNPVSSQLSFALFVAPLLRELAGLPPRSHATLRLATRRDVDSGAPAVPARAPARRAIAWRPSRDRDRIWSPRWPQPTCIIDVPEDVVDLPAGAEVETWDL